MSFSSRVKEELSRQLSPARHCRIAEIAAIISLCGRIQFDEEDRCRIKIHTENAAVARKYFTLLKKTFNISTETKVQHEENGSAYFLKIPDQEVGKRILQSTRFLDSDGRLVSGLRDPVNRMIIKNACCQRAFLRGAFLCVGSMSDPGKGYHLELVCGLQPQALQLQELLAGFEIEARIVRRKKYFVVYIKEGAGISDFLNVTEAHVALMEFENSRVVRDVRNTVNRRVNCETANIAKTVNAAARQVEDILWLQQKYGLENLPDGLRQMAQVRLEHPDAPLKELGTYLDPPVGKSGVNHRLRKLCELADSIRL